ncbi:hypothetical protein HAX54_020985 [Datura stramonium]|uniref:Uncharacterized protein n=1 Tax=Datura stramonium TaxID=4076 RepID=A0ABS8US42_DATST|nr:hypothetical protein [Datura stramonium]
MEKNYILALFDIDHHTLEVYDSLSNSLENTEVVQHVELYTILLPKLLHFLDFERFRSMYGNNFSKLEIIWESCPKVTDCCRFVVMYADILKNHENSTDFDSSTLHYYIKNRSINLSAHRYNKVKKDYQTSPDQVGDDYHENNLMECN